MEIARFYDPEEAYCAKSFLLSHGIDSFVQNDHYLTMAPWMRVALQGYGLQVMASSENDAGMLLETIGGAELEIAEDNPSDTKPPKKSWLWLPVAFATNIPFLPKPKPGWFGLLQSAILLTLYIAVLYSWLWWLHYWLQ